MTSTSSTEADDRPDWITHCFLTVLPGDARDEVARRARPTEVAVGQYIYEPELAIVDEGTVRAFVTDTGGRQLTVSYVRRGGAIGLARELGRSYPAGFQAATPTCLIQVDRTHFYQLLDQYPQLGIAVAREVTRRINELLGELTRVAFASLRQRTAYHLLALTDGTDEQWIRQSDLALAVGVLRESAARTIGQLADDGLVSTGPSGVRVVDPAGLRATAEARM